LFLEERRIWTKFRWISGRKTFVEKTTSRWSRPICSVDKTIYSSSARTSTWSCSTPLLYQLKVDLIETERENKRRHPEGVNRKRKQQLESEKDGTIPDVKITIQEKNFSSCLKEENSVNKEMRKTEITTQSF
jgi:hypothetical protein